MKIRTLLQILISSALLVATLSVQAESETVFELRTYTTHEGKLAALNQRFVDHTLGYFEKHGMRNIGYWIPVDPEKSGNTLIYIVAHKSREAARQSWQSFGQDPGWQKAYAESREDGPIVQSIESVFMTATEYSRIK